MKYSTQQRGTIRPPHRVTLFKGKSNKNHVPTVAQIVSGIIHGAIQPKGDVVSVVKSQNMFVQNVMSHFTLIVLKIIRNLRQEH